MQSYLIFFSKHRLTSSFVFLLLVSGLFLRAYQLGNLPGINGDEAYTTVQMFEMSHAKNVNLSLPTHRTLSPLYGTYVMAIENLLPGLSFWNVRAPALIAGIFLVLSSFLFLNWAFGLERALLASLLILCHPMSIAYSRSAVEQSLMGLAALFPIYFAFEASWVSAILALALAMIIHPLNIFLAPMVFLPLWATVKFRKIKPRTLLLVGLISLFGLFTLLRQILPDNEGFSNILWAFHFLFSDPKSFGMAFARYMINFLHILTGFAAFEYFAGKPTPWVQILWDVFFVVGGVSLWYFGAKALVKSKSKKEIYFLLGFVISVLSLFMVGGPKSLSVGLSRYGTYLIVPAAIATSLLISALRYFNLVIKRRAVIILCSLFLLQFWNSYFLSIYKTGGGYTHRTYATGPKEPKQAVYDWIISQPSVPGLKKRVITEDWWIYWPMRYLSMTQGDIEIIELTKETTAADFDRLLTPKAFAVGFPGGPIWNHLHQRFSADLDTYLTLYQPSSYSPKLKLTAWQYLGSHSQTALP